MAPTTNLKEQVELFRQATVAFHGCHEMLLSSGNISLKAQKISDDFFKQREALVALGKVLERPYSHLELAVHIFAIWAKFAENCPALCLEGASNEAAAIMEGLERASERMWAAVDGV